MSTLLRQEQSILRELKIQLQDKESSVKQENNLLSDLITDPHEQTELENQKLRVQCLQEALIEERRLVSKLKQEAKFKHDESLREYQRLQTRLNEKELQ